MGGGRIRDATRVDDRGPENNRGKTLDRGWEKDGILKLGVVLALKMFCERNNFFFLGA